MTPLMQIHIQKKLDHFSLDVALAVNSGITAIIGPSGAGKTSLLNIIAGLSDGQAKILLNGRDLAPLPAYQRKMGYVFQEGLLFPHLNVRQNLLYGVTTKDDAYFNEMLGLFDLAPLLSRAPNSLSGGEMRRVAIARALLSKPECLLLDEPLSGIDPNRRAAFFPYLERLRERLNIPIFYVTHHMDEVMRLANHVVVMDKGQVVLHGALEDIAMHPSFAALAGENERSVVLAGTISRNGEPKAPYKIALKGGQLQLSHKPHHQHDKAIRVRILARDVALATQKPEHISVLNILKAQIKSLEPMGEHEVDVVLTLTDDNNKEGDCIIARITRTSVERLKLKENMPVWALIKAVAILN